MLYETPKTARTIHMFEPYVNRGAVQEVARTLTHRHEDGRLWIGEGPKVKEFEAALQHLFDFRYCVALNSGTSALRLALAMAGVGPGDEVITTAQTCTATNTPILEQFAIPVFADIQYMTGNIDPKDVEHRITGKTKAIMCVHWAGYPCDMDEMWSIGKRFHIPVIEDGAHALGASYRGANIGAIGDYTMFSFQAIKQITCGDGGMLTLPTEELYHEARRRRWFGIDRVNRVEEDDGYQFWDQSEVGYKMHMNDISASIGLGNLVDWAWISSLRHIIAERYRATLANVPGVTLFESRPERESANWLFTMHVERRADFRRMMTAQGIETGVVHVRNDRHSVFGPRRQDLPQTDRYELTNISIPLHNGMADGDVGDVIDAIKGGW